MPLRIGLTLIVFALTGCAGYYEPSPPPPPPASLTRAASAPAPAPKPSSDGSVELEWTPPDDRTDGKALAAKEIAGYRIYVGRQSRRYTEHQDVRGAGPARYTVRGLQPGTHYYFTITAIDRDGLESPHSNEIRREAR